VIACAVALVVVPILLDTFGVLPPFYRFEGDALIVEARLVSFPPAATLSCLVVAAVGTIASVSIYVARIAQGLASAQERLALQAWRLEQIAPVDASASELRR
jgi:hypothetical protein